ncbi:MAG TPA: ATP-binding cassette domain-containing protein, partial [Bacillota bacterium]|nr:ATP-binding cassette domain-containing protein [Bacillota bacterium]
MAVNVSISIENSSGLLVEGLSKAWGAKQVFSDISFFQAAGTIFGVEGDNGAGKSTLLKILASVLSRDKGEVDFQGVSLDNLSQWRSLIGYVPQELALDERLTVKENIRFWAALRGLEQREIR